MYKTEVSRPNPRAFYTSLPSTGVITSLLLITLKESFVYYNSRYDSVNEYMRVILTRSVLLSE